MRGDGSTVHIDGPVIGGDLTFTGEAIVLDSSLGGNDVLFTDPTILGSNVAIAGNNSIIFDSTLNSEAGEQNNLTLFSDTTTFNGEVGTDTDGELGNGDASRSAVIVGILSLVPLSIAYVVIQVPQTYEYLFDGAFLVAQLGLINLIGTRLQGKMLSRHEEQEGRFYSNWRAAGISLLVFPFSIGIIMVVGATVSTLLFPPTQMNPQNPLGLSPWPTNVFNGSRLLPSWGYLEGSMSTAWDDDDQAIRYEILDVEESFWEGNDGMWIEKGILTDGDEEQQVIIAGETAREARVSRRTDTP